MDSIVFEESVNTEISSSEFVDKQWLYVNDNNNGSYSSQVVLDTTPLANSGSYLNWSEAFILMPLCLQIESPAALLDADLPIGWIAGLKSGYWNMLHSITCEFNNGNIIQQVPFMNVFCSFKNITSWSKNDLTNWGNICGFAPDSSRSWAYNAVAPALGVAPLAASGSGLTNNRNAPYVTISLEGTQAAGFVAYNEVTIATTSSADIRSTWNEGLFERQSFFNYDSALVGTNVNSSQKGYLLSDANCQQIFRSFIFKAANLRAVFIDAVIRLKDIADFFQKCPMLKGSTMRMYLNTNQCYFQVSQRGGSFTVADGTLTAQATLGLNTQPVILGGGGTCPVLYASAGLGQGASALIPLVGGAAPAAATTVNVALSIVRPQFSQMAQNNLVGAAPISSVRLYCPAYTLSPIAEQRYLSLSPTKRVVYNDIFQFSFPNQTTNSPFNILVTNGIPNIRSVLVLPFLPTLSNGVAIAGGVTTSTLLSPFCSTPASPDPLSILNFQIQVSGKNLFINQLQYDFETFCEQLVSSNQLNGSLTTSLSSGLVSKLDFQYLYRYYYGNCSRSLPSEEGVAKSIQIQGTVQSSVQIGVDLMVFVEFEREITIDVRTGARIA
jgi:hypothetical protein